MQTAEQVARTIHAAGEARRAPATVAMMGQPSGILAADYATILAHCESCAALEAQYRCRMDAAALWGQTPEQLRATALHKSRVLAGRRGKKVLVARYGERIAVEIIGR